MSISASLVALIGLTGALIGAAASWIPQRSMLRYTRQAEADHELKDGIAGVLVAAQTIDVQSHLVATVVSGIGILPGVILRALRILAPRDLVACFRVLSEQHEVITRAGVRVMLSADAQTIEMTQAVMDAAALVVSAHTGAEPERLRQRALTHLTGRRSATCRRSSKHETSC